MKLPTNDKRLLIVGRTGSGKTVAAVFQLALRDWDTRPWYVIDFKGDELIAQIPGAKIVNITDPIKNEPGIYIVRPVPGQDNEIENFLWRLYEHENVGLFVDEGYMIARNSQAFRAILTQGRSKNLSLILLTQRPVYLDRFAISEADYYQVYWLNDSDDRKRISQFLPIDNMERLDAYHSYWYDVGDDELTELLPVPPPSEVIDIFQERLPKEELPPKRQKI